MSAALMHFKHAQAVKSKAEFLESLKQGAKKQLDQAEDEAIESAIQIQRAILEHQQKYCFYPWQNMECDHGPELGRWSGTWDRYEPVIEASQYDE